jgi:CheY-like chemotaxis protein/uncharacterized protein (UPF0248 family)
MLCKPQVLIVEDMRETLDDYLLNLRSDEYELTGVCSLEQASAALEQQTYDVVVTDLMLPNNPEDGMQLAEKARSIDATIAVIVFTGYEHTSLVAQHTIRKLGAQAFFTKPLDFRACRKRIHQAILERRYRLASIDAAEQGSFAVIRSPYVAGKALGKGSVMFYGRDEIFDLIRHSIGTRPYHNHLALVGPRRIGKTSILQQLPERLNPVLFLPVYVNCQALGIDPGMPAFFLKLARQIRRGLRRQNVDVSSLPALSPSDLASMPTFVFVEQFLPQLWQIIGTRTLVLCFDEFEELAHKVQRGRLDDSVFEFLRSIMLDEDQVVLVLAGSRQLMDLGKLSHPAGTIIEMSSFHKIGPLSTELARHLIEDPVAYSGMQYDADAIAMILQASGGYPYLIQLICGLLVARRNVERRNQVTVADVRTATDDLLEMPQPGFFWESLTAYQKMVMVVISRLRQHEHSITPGNVTEELSHAQVNCQDWHIPIHRVLHELFLEGLLYEESGSAQSLEYRLVYDLSGAWVRRHKALDEIQEEICDET